MKMKDLCGDYLLITILAIIALSMLLIRVVYTASNKEKITVQEPLKTSASSLIPTNSKIDFEKNFPLWKLLPYIGDGFIIEKYAEPLVLKVSLLRGQKGVAVEKIVKLMEENKIDSTIHKIVWE